MAKVDLVEVVKYYDTVEAVTLTGYKNPPALNKITLTIHDGETISIVGPSGCGKSTLLKVVAGLEYPQSGQVLYNNFDLTDIKPQDRGVGFVFQDYALYPSKKGKGNLRYYFEVHQRTEAEMEQRIRETAELMGVGFDMLLGRLPDTLSGGEKQRVAIARCIVRDPQVFLMDEPICNLDAKLRERTRTEIKKLLNKFQITTLYVTHDQQEAIFMGDRIAVMRSGIIEQVGTFDDLYYSPVNLFVANFIGTPPINLIPATVQDGQVTVQDVTWGLSPEIAAKVPAGVVRMGVRPEGWDVADTAGAGASMKVGHIERLYTERAAFLYGNLAGITISALVPLDYPEVATVHLTPNWDRVYFFSAGDETAYHVPGVIDLF